LQPLHGKLTSFLAFIFNVLLRSSNGISTTSSAGGLGADLLFSRCICQDLKQYSELSCSSTSLIQVIATNVNGSHRGSIKAKRKSIFKAAGLQSFSEREENGIIKISFEKMDSVSVNGGSNIHICTQLMTVHFSFCKTWKYLDFSCNLCKLWAEQHLAMALQLLQRFFGPLLRGIKPH